MTEARRNDPGLIAGLNDLLQLDHDALQAYQVAIDNLENESHRETLKAFRADHARHVDDLANLVRANGGTPLDGAHLSTGLFKLTLQQVGRVGGDTGILVAFEANERQVRDKYWRHAERPHSPEIKAALRRNAEDEERHFSWVLETLRRTGTSPAAVGESVRSALAQVQARAADLMEGAEREVREQLERRGGGSERDRS